MLQEKKINWNERNFHKLDIDFRKGKLFWELNVRRVGPGGGRLI
jgi:hypothetical protein